MDKLPELMTDDAPEAIIMVLGTGIALLVSTVQKCRGNQCRQFWVFRPNGFTDDVGARAREEWECEACGYREWKKRLRIGVGSIDDN